MQTAGSYSYTWDNRCEAKQKKNPGTTKKPSCPKAVLGAPPSIAACGVNTIPSAIQKKIHTGNAISKKYPYSDLAARPLKSPCLE